MILTGFIHADHQDGVLADLAGVPVIGFDGAGNQFAGGIKQIRDFVLKRVGLGELNDVVHAPHITHAVDMAK